MTEHPIVPLELPKDRIRPRNKLPKDRLILKLKSSNGVELSFYSDATNELMIEVVDRFLSYD
ncbi:hypothetical protein BTJ35_07700 [Lactobacillus delbrueckii subsp. bulgaricus]|uniref:hypothetical protein n=1 Tax=Lactobacillus delbrueckii TaxID=1584 RepID=UPI000957FA8B|nr:hypothetical protein [Lactobacillus delbrueckii]APV47946.1 hypothetical protein LB080_08830 [Lactobacillus delbrueckii subsp. bulgaricus]AYC66867.1 hypothetical protein D4Z81_06050 [Lactobacillus delbrueckii subsp. bulgaricus]MBT9089321.1 hypothetical protein [Lactobacillus delbrueckii subsp. bulgaricus]MBT9090923.1 hypothetical protein [Lactobacillus delbrueckii subsp. bulgaricus]MBT9092746.1 hypothetical protein [Lactobacillus delbrueckii subsp. bulgaricus]